MGDPPFESTVPGDRERLDAAFYALSNAHRRRLLHSLLEENPQEALTVSGSDDEEIDPESVRLSMYHVHLPNLAEAGFVEWDRAQNQVRKGPHFSVIKDLFRRLEE